MVELFDLIVLGCVVEPAGADGDVDLAGIPDEAAAEPGDLRDAAERAEVLGLGVEMGDAAWILLVGRVVGADDWDDAPFALAGHAGFVPDPTGVGAHDRDHRIRLQLPDEGEIARPIIDLPLSVRALAAGPVEPD